MRRLARALALFAIMVNVTGCFAWQTVGALPRTSDLPTETRFTKFDGSTIVLTTSRIENDTIKGYQSGSTRRQVIPLAHVDLIETKKFQAKQSVIGGTVTLVALYLVVRAVKNTELVNRPLTPP